ncbi:23S rRNA (cytidine(2498)-2'-O)-methyltransferase RlmM [Halomonas sp. HP20-15]|uniref:23S rRNA (cytidine(2498)-2'-O)-methyltransferase RlmM n=1 Tax=Halomonas sp. HP20-15 TaxID=3085901 RepID=UPI002981F21A|nr:23S rRNA (cytidine(2498)-2'-O)-methyltransferase RlmM [Halomonas sp. HP20-15]MDW5376755.1 23S rRNA (cytidine(2498)-2'-O)-methyltransferase RlmM [Halomonas sp. HP20-15]
MSPNSSRNKPQAKPVSTLVPNELLLYCRPGFENDLSAELQSKIGALDSQDATAPGVAEPGIGHVRWVMGDAQTANALHRELPLEALVFARQSLVALPPLVGLSRDDRLTPIIAQVVASGWSFESLWQETPDSNEAKALAGLMKALQKPLESTLRKRGALRRKAGGRRLHLYWTAGDGVQLGMSFPGNRSEALGGIRRLRAPHDAPSRSTLKLEEAWHVFIPRDEWEERLHAGMQAADLGAAPGGWTYQLVRQGMHVYAIDNGPMGRELMATGQVEHLREDGFTWQPPQRLDWLVCDIVDKPMRVIDMVGRWLLKRWCREAIFNLKLPMKQRWAEVARCIEQLETRLADAGIEARIACKQLYHDREEVTVHVRLP